ncbi:hypothetical protein Tco_0561031 [Tanacetum coccineum]
MKDIAQKSKIKGDENSSFYHGILNSKRRYLAIRDTIPVHSRSPTYKLLNEQQGDDLTSSITMEEPKKAVWSCGNDKAPGPDGFTFYLIKRYWDIFKNDVFNCVPRISGSHPWARIVALIAKLRDKGLINHETLQRKIGDGSSTKF